MHRTFPAIIALLGTSSVLLVDSAIKRFLILLSPDCWTSACGLTMAGNLPLQGRLQAIMSDRLNRRQVTTMIGTLAILFGVSVAIPISMLRAATTASGGAQLRPTRASLPLRASKGATSARTQRTGSSLGDLHLRRIRDVTCSPRRIVDHGQRELCLVLFRSSMPASV